MMNFKIFSLTISSILLVIKETDLKIVNKKYQTPDLGSISNKYQNLFKSLVGVNKERVKALSNFFKAVEPKEIKTLFRAGTENGEDSNSKVEVIILNNEDANPEIRKPNGLVLNNIRCGCNDKRAERDEAYTEDLKEAMTRQNRYNDHLFHHNDENSVETDGGIVLSIDKQLFNERNSYLNLISPDSSASQHELLSMPLKSVIGGRSRTCISPRRGYELCKSACKESYGRACASRYGCSERLYHRLRKECKKNCKREFKHPYGDDYYDDYY